MNYLELPAIKVEQPLGDFYVVAIKARDLLRISFSEPLKYIDNTGNVKGSQRPNDIKRLKEIAKYIDSVEMAFPNSIILAANYTPTGNISKDEAERWRIIRRSDELHRIIIPQAIPLAAIIDGQHRLKAFDFVENQDRFDNLELVCSVYFDLPNSYQAFLFATINSNQKKVDRSLALEQFGYNVDDEPEKSWTPEKFAVFLSRKLNIDEENSPFYRHIKVAPLNEEVLFEGTSSNNWTVSTATIVDGINSLISSNPKRDRIIMQQRSVLTGRSRSMIKDIKDVSPLRQLFIDGKDQTIYSTLIEFFNATNDLLWRKASGKSYIIKTVGIQALFDVLKIILVREQSSNASEIDFKSYLNLASNIDFSDRFFQASGIGRSRIRNVIAIAANLISIEKIKNSDLPFYDSLLAGSTTSRQPEKMIWDEEAENSVLNTLEKVHWNYDNKTVSITPDEDYQNIQTFSSLESFISHLSSIAESAFSSNLPDDYEFAEQQKENFDTIELVKSCLIDFEPNLRKLGWA